MRRYAVCDMQICIIDTILWEEDSVLFTADKQYSTYSCGRLGTHSAVGMTCIVFVSAYGLKCQYCIKTTPS